MDWAFSNRFGRMGRPLLGVVVVPPLLWGPPVLVVVRAVLVDLRLCPTKPSPLSSSETTTALRDDDEDTCRLARLFKLRREEFILFRLCDRERRLLDGGLVVVVVVGRSFSFSSWSSSTLDAELPKSLSDVFPRNRSDCAIRASLIRLDRLVEDGVMGASSRRGLWTSLDDSGSAWGIFRIFCCDKKLSPLFLRDESSILRKDACLR